MTRDQLVSEIRAMDDGQWLRGFREADEPRHWWTLSRVLVGQEVEVDGLLNLHSYMLRVLEMRDV
jgi:hypothetical protein